MRHGRATILDAEATAARDRADRAGLLVLAKYQPLGHGDSSGRQDTALPVAVELASEQGAERGQATQPRAPRGRGRRLDRSDLSALTATQGEGRRGVPVGIDFHVARA